VFFNTYSYPSLTLFIAASQEGVQAQAEVRVESQDIHTELAGASHSLNVGNQLQQYFLP
jgi:hypothetical protein